jgi:hypothetical protein
MSGCKHANETSRLMMYWIAKRLWAFPEGPYSTDVKNEMFVCAILARFSADYKGNCRLSHDVFTECQLVLCGFHIACFKPVLRASMKVRGFEQANKVVPLIPLNPISEIETGKGHFYCCTVHFDDSVIFTHQLMHLYIYYQNTKTLCSFDSSYMFRHTAYHHQGASLSWLKSLVKNIRSEKL